MSCVRMISSVAVSGNTLVMSNQSKRFAPKHVVLAVVPFPLQLLLNQLQLNQNSHTQHQLKLQSKHQSKHQFKLQCTTHLSTQLLRSSETDQATRQHKVDFPPISTLDQSSKSSLSTSQSIKFQSTRLQSNKLPAVTSSLVVLPGSQFVETHPSKSFVLELVVFVETRPSTLLQLLSLSLSLSTGLLNDLSFSNQSTKLQLNKSFRSLSIKLQLNRSFP